MTQVEQLTGGANVARRLAAVAFADVAGFSKLMELDDVQTMLKWNRLRRDLIEPKITEHRGCLLRVVGDGLFIEFASAVDAVRWADDVQRAIEQDQGIGDTNLRVRIGINVEDVIVNDNDLHGNGVNVAARLQDLAGPGEAFVTGMVRDLVWNKVPIALVDVGERHVKNISQPIRVYRVEPAKAVEGAARGTTSGLVWSKRPSVAVLPFRNLGGDPDEDYFGEGMTEDIITALSRTRLFFVIARNSTLRYRERHPDVRQIASDLGTIQLLVNG